jgi:hypothetical protein
MDRIPKKSLKSFLEPKGAVFGKKWREKQDFRYSCINSVKIYVVDIL